MAARTTEQRYGVAAYWTKPGGEKVRIPKTSYRESDGVYFYRASNKVPRLKLKQTKPKDVYEFVTVELENMRSEEHRQTRTRKVDSFVVELFEIAEKTGAVSPGYLSLMKSRYSQNIKPKIGHMIISQVEAQDIRSIYVTMDTAGWNVQAKGGRRGQRLKGEQKDYSNNTKRQVRSTLSYIWRAAMSDEFKRLTTNNPIKGVVMGAPETEDEAVTEDHVLTNIEWAQLDGYYRNLRADRIYWAVFQFARYTGLRLREVLAMRWSDIDFEDGTIYVERQLTEKPLTKAATTFGRYVPAGTFGDRPLKGDTLKKRKHVRRIVLEDGLRETILEHRNHMKYVGRSVAPGAMLFQSRDHEGPISGDSISTSLRRARVALGFTRDDETEITFHWLRHTYASEHYRAGTPLRILSDHLGHATTAITEGIYVHFKPDAGDFEEMREAARRIAAKREAAQLKLAS